LAALAGRWVLIDALWKATYQPVGPAPVVIAGIYLAAPTARGEIEEEEEQEEAGARTRLEFYPRKVELEYLVPLSFTKDAGDSLWK